MLNRRLHLFVVAAFLGLLLGSSHATLAEMTPSGSASSRQDAAARFDGVAENRSAAGSPSPSASGIDGSNNAISPHGNPSGVTARSFGADSSNERLLNGSEPWTWQLLPDGLMYKSYLAGNKEPRLGSQWVHERNLGWQWDPTLGGRIGLVRYGTTNDAWPEGWQWDLEGAALVRMNMEHNNDVDHVDFRAGAPLTTRQGPWEFKAGYYHLSSHLGDEYMVRNVTLSRINYVRETLVFGTAIRPTPDIRLYSEAGWAFYVDGGAKPWEFQFGAEFSPIRPSGPSGDPFVAVNCHLHEETDFSGNLTVQTGWQWRGRSGHLLRVGLQYFNGMSELAQFYDTFEEQVGLGMWYDF